MRILICFMITLAIMPSIVMALDSGSQICGHEFKTLTHAFRDSQGREILAIDNEGSIYFRSINYAFSPPGTDFVGIKFTTSGQVKQSFSFSEIFFSTWAGMPLESPPTTKKAVAFQGKINTLFAFDTDGNAYLPPGSTPVATGSLAKCPSGQTYCTNGEISETTVYCQMTLDSEGSCVEYEYYSETCEDVCIDPTGNDPNVMGSVNDSDLCSSGDLQCPLEVSPDYCGTDGKLHEMTCDATQKDKGQDIIVDCSASNVCNGYIYTSGSCQDGACKTEQVTCNQPGDWNGNGVACNCDCGGIDQEETGPARCRDGIDNDCDGTADYTGTGTMSRDTGCGFEVTSITLEKSCPTENSNIWVDCTYFADVNECKKATIETPTGITDCSFVSWNGNVARFTCNVGAYTTTSCNYPDSYTATCTVKQDCIQTGTDKTAEVYSLPGQCSNYNTQSSCEVIASCDWCTRCDANKRFSGMTTDTCVPAGQCVYACKLGECTAGCDSNNMFKLEGTLCKYACNLNTCMYGTTTCSTASYCSDVSTRQYGGQCTASGCTFTPEDCNLRETGGQCWNECKSGTGDIYKKCNDWICNSGDCGDSLSDYFKTERVSDCADTCDNGIDGGNNKNTPGSTADFEECTTQSSCPSTIHKDTCNPNQDTLTEWYCSGNDAVSADITCGQEYGCKDDGSGGYCFDCDDDNDGLCEAQYDSPGDCDDNDISKWQMLQGYTDADGDGYGAGSIIQVCSGSSLPSGYATVGGDCNDADLNKWRLLTGYTDSDGDGFGTGSSQQVCSGSSLPSGFATVGGDCDDSRSNVCPSATQCPEQCDALDHDCIGGPYNGFTYDNCQAYCQAGGYVWGSQGTGSSYIYCCGDDSTSDTWCAGTSSCYRGTWYTNHCGDGQCNCGETCSTCSSDCGGCCICDWIRINPPGTPQAICCTAYDGHAGVTHEYVCDPHGCDPEEGDTKCVWASSCPWW